MKKKDIADQKKTTAENLAKAHYQLEPGVVRIIRILGSQSVESNSAEPVKLLEVNENTIAVGIRPIGFDAAPAMGILSPSVIVEVTPAEYELLRQGHMPLPRGWRLGEELPRGRNASI